MKCAWNELLSILPPDIRREVDKPGKEELEELRLRVGKQIELIFRFGSRFLQRIATEDDIQFVVNTASRYSPWSASTAAHGYITAAGGHRIGMCGDCVTQSGKVTGVRHVTSLCIRVAKSILNISAHAPKEGSVLILGPPGAGKTTFLRDLVRQRSSAGHAVAVVDERGEIFPRGDIFDPGPRTDVLTGCTKAQGVDMALRTMGPQCIAVDEITAQEDCHALMSAGWCGVALLATAHAADCEDLQRREVYHPLWNSGLFTEAIVLSRDKSWRLERMELCT